jgi:hypothetical protein
MSFTRVSKAQPCPICEKPDWCRVFADGWVECMRVQSDRPAKSGGFLHRQWQRHLSPLEPGRFRPVLPPPPTINATVMHRAWLAATPAAALDDFAASLGVSVASLVAVGAAWAPVHSAWAFPMRDGYGNVVGIRLRNERGKFAVRGSRQGIFVANCGLTPPDDLVANGAQGSPSRTGASRPTLFICEGPTDTAAAVDLGLFAAGRPNCCCGGPEIRIYARRHAVSRVVVISDNDKPGLDGARKVGGELKLPFAVYVPPAKDLREFVRLGGTRAMIENTLKGTVWQNG